MFNTHSKVKLNVKKGFTKTWIQIIVLKLHFPNITHNVYPSSLTCRYVLCGLYIASQQNFIPFAMDLTRISHSFAFISFQVSLIFASNAQRLKEYLVDAFLQFKPKFASSLTVVMFVLVQLYPVCFLSTVTQYRACDNGVCPEPRTGPYIRHCDVCWLHCTLS